MSKNANPPATKADITELRADIGSLHTVLERLEASHQVLLAKSEQLDRHDERFTAIDRALEQLATNFDARLDTMWKSLREDATRILNVQIRTDQRLERMLQDHERRLDRLETHAGLAA